MIRAGAGRRAELSVLRLKADAAYLRKLMLAHPGSFPTPVRRQYLDLASGGRAGLAAGQGRLFAGQERSGSGARSFAGHLVGM